MFFWRFFDKNLPYIIIELNIQHLVSYVIIEVKKPTFIMYIIFIFNSTIVSVICCFGKTWIIEKLSIITPNRFHLLPASFLFWKLI